MKVQALAVGTGVGATRAAAALAGPPTAAPAIYCLSVVLLPLETTYLES